MVGKPVFVVPFLKNLNLPEEDGLGIERRLKWESTGPTKSDKEKVNEVYIADIKNRLAALGFDDCHVVATSSKNGIGMKELQYSMLQF